MYNIESLKASIKRSRATINTLQDAIEKEYSIISEFSRQIVWVEEQEELKKSRDASQLNIQVVRED